MGKMFARLSLPLVASVLFALLPESALAQKIRIFAGSSPIFAPAFIADQKGFFKAEGLDVLVRPFTSGAEATEGFRSGAADFLVASDVPLLYLLVGGDTVMLAQFSANPDMLVIVGPKSSTNAADLKGKKIGLVTKSASEYLLNNYLKRAGLGVGDVERVHLAPFDQVPALARGDVYALSSWKPFDLKITELTGDKYQVATNNGQEKYVLFSGIVAKRDFVAKNAADTEKVVRALVKASQWLATADAKTRGEALGAYLKTDAKDVQHVIANNSWDLKVTPAFKSTMVDIEDFLAKQGLIKTRVNWNSAYDWSFLKKVDPSLVP
ncbi:MAG TPA: NrtA/SsuA/CpmA family ABC transporter substrate-binding protein [Burkholderiaceae bacterium]|nr:NrtA/SsuA/CpmA family ABC transporter substrate-binding protein [Burkholderiaceae bacterium]